MQPDNDANRHLEAAAVGVLRDQPGRVDSNPWLRCGLMFWLTVWLQLHVLSNPYGNHVSMRIGIFGGSFDPIHNGHLLLAESCREQASLDQVWFVPAAVSPHKQGEEPTDAADRIEMARLAVGGHEAFFVSEIETSRGGVSYTVDTLEAIKLERSDDELFFLMGADSLVDLPKWRSPEKICELARILVVGRPESPLPDLSILTPFVKDSTQAGLVATMPLVDYSSTEIRRRCQAGESIRYRVPRGVEKYIEAKRLYGSVRK